MFTSSLVLVSIILSIILALGCTALVVLEIISLYKIFTKAGIEGWKAIIPFYNMYVLAKIVWGNGNYFWLTFIPFGGIIYQYITYYKLAKCYGKSSGFGVGMILLNPFFLIVLGFGNNLYYGPTSTGKKGTIIASVVTGIIYVVIFVLCFIIAMAAGLHMFNNVYSYDNRKPEIIYSDGLDEFDENSKYSQETEETQPATNYQSSSSGDRITSSLSDFPNFETVKINNSFDESLATNVFVFKDGNNYTSDSFITSSKSGISLQVSYNGYGEDPEALVKEEMGYVVDTLNDLSFYTDVSVGKMYTGDGWALQQVDYNYHLGDETYSCFEMIKVDIVKGYPVIAEITVDNSVIEDDSKELLSDVCYLYGIDFQFD